MRIFVPLLVLIYIDNVKTVDDPSRLCNRNEDNVNGLFACMAENKCPSNVRPVDNGIEVKLKNSDHNDRNCGVTPNLNKLPGTKVDGMHSCTTAFISFVLEVPEGFNPEGGIKLPGLAGTTEGKEQLGDWECVGGKNCDDAFSTRLQMHHDKVLNLYYYPPTGKRQFFCQTFKSGNGNYYHDGEKASTCYKDEIGISIKGHASGNSAEGPKIKFGEKNTVKLKLSVENKSMKYRLTVTNTDGTDEGSAEWEMGDQFYINNLLGALHYGQTSPRPPDTPNQYFVITNIDVKCGDGNPPSSIPPPAQNAGDSQLPSAAPSPAGSDSPSDSQPAAGSQPTEPEFHRASPSHSDSPAAPGSSPKEPTSAQPERMCVRMRKISDL
jgi:hypothetical protein